MKLRIIILMGLLGVSFQISFAGNEILTKQLRGSAIAANQVLSISPSNYTQARWQVQHPSVTVRLYLPEDRRIIRTSNSKYCVKYRLLLTSLSNTVVTVTDSVIVNYMNIGDYIDVDYRYYQNYKSAQLTIISVNTTMPEDLFLELRMDLPRYSTLDSLLALSDVNGAYLSSSNELQLTWGYLPGADFYEVEWLFVDNPVGSDNIKYNFSNATNVNTSNNYYEVSLAYPKGTILYRVRGVGTYFRNDTLFPLFGKWSYAVASSITLPPASHPEYRYDYAGLEDSLTWQYTAVYAEEGKRKEVITFFDGSLRNRQEVTVMNTDNVAIVGETFYDHVGRQALQSIPAPTPSRGIRYYGTNGNTQGLYNGIFEKSRYDADSTIGNARPFTSDAGSAQYYSANNPFLSQPHWVNLNQTPADSGYTYTHTRYLNDGTDRIHSQSNVGEGFQLGSGKETKYYYGNPMQVELDRLFGNEVGDASHYQKVLAIDANGETTVSYYDMKERLIASAIIPNADTSKLLQVDNTPVTKVLHNTVAFDESNRQYVQNITVDATGNYTFEYHFSPSDPLLDTCHGVYGSMDCRYKITLNLWNPNQNQYVFNKNVITDAAIAVDTSVSLVPGNYLLYKNVESVSDNMTDNMLLQYGNRQRDCVPYEHAVPRDCYTACENACMLSHHVSTPDSCRACIDSCQNPPQHFATECEAKRMALIADMSPGGQYFDNIITSCPPDSVAVPYDYSHRNDFMNAIPGIYYAYPISQWLARYNIPSTNKKALWDSLRVNWDNTMADTLLEYHPEFNLYQYLCECGAFEQQQLYDSIFLNTQDFNTASALGLFNPLYMPLDENTLISDNKDLGYQLFDTLSTGKDAYFFVQKTCCDQNNDSIFSHIRQRLNSYFEWNNDGKKFVSVWYVIFDPDNMRDGNCPSGAIPQVCEAIANIQNKILPQWAEQYGSMSNARWKLFQSIYLYLREETKYCFLTTCVKIPYYYYSTFQWDQRDWWSNLYPPSALDYCSLFLNAQDDCANMPLTTGTNNNFQIRYICNPSYGLNADNSQALQDSSLNVLKADCQEQCLANANDWMAELEDYFITHCPNLTPLDKQDIKNELINMCMNGCQQCFDNQNFEIGQLINLDEFRKLLMNHGCQVTTGDYTRIIFQRHGENPVDCGCNNYQDFLNANDLTFWSETEDIETALSNAGISVGDIDGWNNFCKWSRYDYLLTNNNDTEYLYGLGFPDDFKCDTTPSDSINCELMAALEVAALDTLSLQQALSVWVDTHRARYQAHCMAHIADTLTLSWSSGEFLYTLYYYDQADNLIKTVPPKGVHLLTQTQIDSTAQYRTHIARYDTILSGFIHPAHTMITNYRYNTLNQITRSYLPDHDSCAVVFYDILSRPVLSQNGKQKLLSTYSYTLYDNIGRIIEVGQVYNPAPFVRDSAASPTAVANFITGGTRSEISRTFYDSPLVSTLGQTNLRNRIAAVTYNDTLSPNLVYQSATHYSYDIHGNVKRLLQDIPALNNFARRYVAIDYEYDLISGNVNKVWFQKGKPEQLMHRYRYDADNRITQVFSSNTLCNWHTAPGAKALFQTSEHLEARYFYLPDGKLTRTELGQKQIQGTDYAYTLQGWLKDINGYRTDSNTDIGKDGNTAVLINRNFARDAAALMLQYNPNDYIPIAGTNSHNLVKTGISSLFNGNISALSANTFGENPLLKVFRYDKLNRIKRMQTATLSGRNWGTLTNNYATAYTYDYNGNITSLHRNSETAQSLHNIGYQYNNTNNKLNSITATGIHSSTYTYDPIGNLTTDHGENLQISWNAAGKVKQIITPTDTIRYTYSPTGQRLTKEIIADSPSLLRTYYIYDATGNVMCIYTRRGDTLTAGERPIYGTKRLGELRQQIILGTNGSLLRCDNATIGTRHYELTDHLGNVMAVVSDRKTLNTDSVYYPVVISYTDYYPFGYPIKSRSWQMGEYRYGFNGQESDDEVYGEKQMFGYEFRQYDSRLGRWWGIDPMSDKYPSVSPYAFCEGNPIFFKDSFGKEKIPLVPEDSPLMSGINNYSNNDPVIHIFAHSDGMYLYDAKGNIIKDIKVFIETHSKQWNINHQDGKSEFTIIVLHSCNAGKGGNQSLAAKLSLLLPNTMIVAGTKLVSGSNPRLVGERDENYNFVVNGAWSMFVGGKKVNAFIGSSTPNFSKKSIAKYKALYGTNNLEQSENQSSTDPEQNTEQQNNKSTIP